MMFERIYKLFEEQDRACNAVRNELPKLYPSGTLVGFQKGRGNIVARAIMVTSSGDSHRMLVKNVNTGKEYWIHLGQSFLPAILEIP